MATPLSYASKVQQHLGELEKFLEKVAGWNVKSYCEIGCKFGGLVWRVAQVIDRHARIVAVDLPNAVHGRSDSEESLVHCIQALKGLGKDAHLIIGDSTADAIVKRVEALGPYDLLFIDANHTEAYVRKDFINYAHLARIVCFHDIGQTHMQIPGRSAIEVPKVWAELKQTYRFGAVFDEIKLDTGHNGIGIMEWH